MTTTITDLDDFKALDPFFRIIEKGLDGIADGGHFFDLPAEKVIFEYIITVPGCPPDGSRRTLPHVLRCRPPATFRTLRLQKWHVYGTVPIRTRKPEPVGVPVGGSDLGFWLERTTGFEPATLTLAR
jgi:hypothetical protein